MGIFFKRGNEDYEEKKITNDTKTMLVIFDEKTKEPIHIFPGESKIVLKAVRSKLPYTREIIRGNFEG